MPSTAKTLYFVSSALVASVSLGLIGYGMSTEWASATMDCARSGEGISNGSAQVTLTLFSGIVVRSFCPFFGGDTEEFEVVPTLAERKEVTSMVLHIVVLFLLAACVLCSACSILISLYNSVSNPYETYMGPIGVYVCSSLGACLSVVALIIFVVNISVTGMAEELVKNFVTGEVDLSDKSTVMQLGYYLIVPYAALCLVTVGVIYIYEHAAYTQRREQQRPTEDAPKEIMMY